MSKGRVVILTALNLEYEAVRNELVDVAVHWHPAGTRFETGRIGEGGREVALGLVGKGNHPAAVLAERAIAEFSPAVLLFVGVAGALWPNIKLGDIVIASQVYAYHGGTSEDDGFKARPRTWEISHRAAQIVQHLIRTDGWRGHLTSGDRSQAHFGPIAAGEVVRDSTLSEHARWIRAIGPTAPNPVATDEAGSAEPPRTRRHSRRPWRNSYAPIPTRMGADR